MKIIVGLGNPGAQYRHTRHNIGFMVLDDLVKQFGGTNQIGSFTYSKKLVADIYKEEDFIFIKPNTFMNASGQAVRAVLDYYKIDYDLGSDFTDLYVVHDDLDIALGQYKIRFGHGPRAHNGLLSIYQHLKTDKINHVRIGVDGRDGSRDISGSAYVLQKFMSTEQDKVKTVVEKVVRELIS